MGSGSKNPARTKKQRQRDLEKKLFARGVAEGSRVLYQALCIYIGVLEAPPESVKEAKAVLRDWLEDGSAGFELDEETKSQWDRSMWSILSAIRESVTRNDEESSSGLILPPSAGEPGV